MEEIKQSYLPPLVAGNNLKQYIDYKSTLNEINLDIGGYIRISTQKDSQLTSIENQKKYLKEWAEVNGYHLVRFYVDIKSGAYSYLRNEMNQLREDIEKGKIKGILSKEISRTSRDIMDILELKRSLADNGAFFISVKEGYDSRTDDDEFLLIIHAGLAQKERKMTSSRVKVTQMIKAKEGKTNVPCPAYGYRLSEDRQHIVVDGETSKVYKLIVEKFLEGWGQLKICKWLNQQSIPTKKGGKWHTNSIKTILSNPVYLGITIYNATTLMRDSKGKRRRVVRPQSEWVVRNNTHEPLINEADYNKIQQIIEERKEKDSKEWSCSKKYLLSGQLYCDICKGKIFGTKTVSNNRVKAGEGNPYTFYSYVDQNRSGACDTKTKYWNMGRVDNIVMDEIKKFFSDKALIEERLKSKQYLFNRDIKLIEDAEHRESLNSDLEKINNAIRKQQEAFENGVLSMDEYKTRLTELRDQKNHINKKIEAVNKQLKEYDSVNCMGDRFEEVKSKVMDIIEHLDDLDYNTKEILLHKLVKRIYLRSDYTIRIEYTFDE